MTTGLGPGDDPLRDAQMGFDDIPVGMRPESVVVPHALPPATCMHRTRSPSTHAFPAGTHKMLALRAPPPLGGRVVSSWWHPWMEPHYQRHRTHPHLPPSTKVRAKAKAPGTMQFKRFFLRGPQLLNPRDSYIPDE